MKPLLILCITLVCGCTSNPTTPIIPLQIVHETLDLSEYKSLAIQPIGDNICYSYDDFSRTIELLNRLKDYIVYQQSIITKLDEYYNPKIKK